jgi:GNAT superfamily N-acetyltransferase
LRSQPFDPSAHDVEDFHSGEDSLDDWIKTQAVSATLRGTARVWVWIDEDGRVVAYYSLSAHKVTREAVPSRLGRGGPREIPAILLGRLALVGELQGQGLGVELVADAVHRVAGVARTVGVRLLVVEALNERIARFYGDVGFRRVPGSLLLVQRVVDLAAAIDEAGGG